MRQNWFDGWRLFALLSLTLLTLSIWIAGMRGFEVDGVRMVIRFTARTSLVLFCLAFAGAALALMWPNAWTRWLRRNRRYLGVSFAASHGIHAVAIAAFAVMDPAGYAAATSIASYIFGGIGYAFIIAMTATSFDRTATAIGARTWRATRCRSRSRWSTRCRAPRRARPISPRCGPCSPTCLRPPERDRGEVVLRRGRAARGRRAGRGPP